MIKRDTLDVEISPNRQDPSTPFRDATLAQDDAQNQYSSSTFASLLSPSLKNLLEGQSELTNITDSTAKIIVLNPMAKMMLTKKENHDAICTAITQTSGQTISHVEFSFMSKDEYFQMKMPS